MRYAVVLLSCLMCLWGFESVAQAGTPTDEPVEILLQKQAAPQAAATGESASSQAPRKTDVLVGTGESEKDFRHRIGFRVMFFLILFCFLAHALKQSFWKGLDKTQGNSEKHRKHSGDALH